MSTVTALCSFHGMGTAGYTVTQISAPPLPKRHHTTVDQLATSYPYATPYSFCKCSCELRPLDSNTRSQHLITESVLPIRTEN